MQSLNYDCLYKEANANGVIIGTISLLVESERYCENIVRHTYYGFSISILILLLQAELSQRVTQYVSHICNCTVISSSLECCHGNQALYKFNLSSPTVTIVTNGSTDVKLQQCYRDNCTCDSNSRSSESQQIQLIVLSTICASLVILVLLMLLITCYK